MEKEREEVGGPTEPGRLKYYRHPYQSTTYYAAYGPNHVRITRGEQWGEFDRNAYHLGGPLRSADPSFCRWVSGEHIDNARLREANSKIHCLTRLGQEKAT
jgi:hypothetical protein